MQFNFLLMRGAGQVLASLRIDSKSAEERESLYINATTNERGKMKNNKIPN